ncbi:E3 ubiquitin-protein ligase WAV3-like [Silene latifolia]|uniref:E3 ubiquitin-protein ligase WAV3-like n=1 Tax=Silene latifolia TaxID=37657 RepID=UPI003D77CAA4
MVNGWRRAFCTSIPKDSRHPSKTDDTQNTPKLSLVSKFNFFSSSSNSTTPTNPSTPRIQTPSTIRCQTAVINDLTEAAPRLKCKTTTSTPTSKSPRLFSSTPSSPRSPSTFSLLLKTSLRLSKPSRCGICVQSVKSGQGTAIFTAECSHVFHFPCVASLATKNNGLLLSCPVCGCQWKEAPFIGAPKLNITNTNTNNLKKPATTDYSRVYDDDEPLMSPVSGIRFNSIPETDEESEESEIDVDFPGFFSGPVTPRSNSFDNRRGVQISISPEAAVVAVGRSYETYAVLLSVIAPPPTSSCRRQPVDLVAVLDIGGDMNSAKLQAMKRAMKSVIFSMSSNDRLSIVVYSSGSKRLLPLRRMTPSGRRSARRIIDALNLSNGSCVNDALRKAAKVIQDRKEKSHFSAIILLDGQYDDGSRSNLDRRFDHVSSTRFSHLEIPVHTFRVGEELLEDSFLKLVNRFLSVVVLDVRVQFGFGSGSAAAQIAAVFSCTGRPGLLNPGSAKLGDFYSGEVREILIEMKVPAASIGSHKLLSVRSYFKDPSSSMKQVIYGGDKSLVVPRPHTIRSSDPSIQRLRGLFVMTRAVAESRRLVGDKNDLVGAERLLTSARAVLGQPSFKVLAAEEYRKRVEAELAEVRWRRQAELDEKKKREKDGGCCIVDEKGDPLTPTSAWKAAERLAKVAVMRKSLNRVSDLHGFEDARF